MPTYSLVVTGMDGHEHTPLVDFPDDQTAIADARHVLTDQHRSVAVARGSGDGLEFLGAWDREEDGGERWTAAD